MSVLTCNSERVIYNDIVYQVSQLMKKLSETSDKDLLAHIKIELTSLV